MIVSSLSGSPQHLTLPHEVRVGSNRMDKKLVVREIFEQGWNNEQFAGFASHIAESVHFNYRNSGFPTNLRQLKELVSLWRNAFPDLHFQVIDMVEEDDLVAVNLVFTGTHLGQWYDVPPTGNRVRVDEMMFFRFDEGRIVEMWEVYDESGMRSQLASKGL